MDVAAPLSRIGFRYVVGWLVAKGYSVNPEMAADADLQAVAYYLMGGGLALFSEGWWYLARRYGWAQ
jgi:hypothetical protein